MKLSTKWWPVDARVFEEESDRHSERHLRMKLLSYRDGFLTLALLTLLYSLVLIHLIRDRSSSSIPLLVGFLPIILLGVAAAVRHLSWCTRSGNYPRTTALLKGAWLALGVLISDILVTFLALAGILNVPPLRIYVSSIAASLLFVLLLSVLNGRKSNPRE